MSYPPHIDRSILTGGKHLPKKDVIYFYKIDLYFFIYKSSYNQKTMSITTETFFKMMEENQLPTLTREDLDECDAIRKKMSMPYKGCYDCKKYRHLERVIDGKTYCLECAPKHEKGVNVIHQDGRYKTEEEIISELEEPSPPIKEETFKFNSKCRCDEPDEHSYMCMCDEEEEEDEEEEMPEEVKPKPIKKKIIIKKKKLIIISKEEAERRRIINLINK
jgi:Mg2+ and Co2+ transporter CorA